jgi:RNA polymerase sigma-70 factor (ECF subfamily)
MDAIVGGPERVVKTPAQTVHPFRARRDGMPLSTMDPIAFDLEPHLQRHGTSLRRLAHELVHDRAAAEDAVQETWLRALRRPPQREPQVGGWLATVLRHVVGRSLRGERRRGRRERDAARSEIGSDHVEVLARSEIVQRLLTAVRELDAPYRETIWQRYFEERPPREIAARDGVPLATVKSRLQRGLQQLRERLGDEGETDWRAAMTAAFGFGEGAAAAGTAVVAGGVTMAVWTKVAVAAAAVGIAAVLWWPRLDTPPRDERTAASMQMTAAHAPVEPGPGVQRIEVTPPSTAPVAVSSERAAEPAVLPARIRGRVVAAETGEPVAGAEVYRNRSIGGVRWEPDDSLFTTGPDGRFEFEVVPGRTPGLTLRAPDRITCTWQGAIPVPGAEQDIGDLPLRAGIAIRGRLVDERGAAIRARVLVDLYQLSDSGGASSALARGVRPMLCEWWTDENGEFVVPRLVALGPCKWHVPSKEYELVRPRGEFALAADGPTSFELVLRPRPRIRGVVVDEAGEVVAGIGLADQPVPFGLVVSNSDGCFEIEKQRLTDEAATSVHVCDSGAFLPHDPIVDVPWGTHDLRIVMRRPVPFVVEVSAPDGTPIEEFGVVIDRPGIGGQRRGKVQQRANHERGTLAVDGVAPGCTSLRVLPTSRAWMPTELIAVKDTGPLHVVLQPRLPASVRVVAGDAPVPGAVVRLARVRAEIGKLDLRRLRDPHADEAWLPGMISEIVDSGITDANGMVPLRRDRDVEGRCLLVQVEGRPELIVNEPVFPSHGAPLVVALPILGRIVGKVELRGWERRQVGVTLVLEPGTRTKTPEPDGSFEFTDVSVGRHTVFLRFAPGLRGGRLSGSDRAVEVGGDQPAQLRFDLADHPLATIAGQLLANGPLPAGLVIDGIRIGSDPTPEVLGSGSVAADGRFLLANLLPGRYRLAWRLGTEQKAWLSGLQAETFELRPGEQLQHVVPYRARRLTVRFQRADGGSADGVRIRARCGDLFWPALGFFSPQVVSGPLVLDPAPVLPVKFAGFAANCPWSAPIVMPPDRAEAEVTVVLPDPPR